MRVSGRHFWPLVGAIVFSIGLALRTGATVSPSANNKVIIYPTAQDSIDQLHQLGITNIRKYGAYWLVQVTADQVPVLKQRYAGRAVDANYLNKIEFRSMTVDTTTAEPLVVNSARQTARSGNVLRLVQFVGPIQPEWLDQIKAVGSATIASYIPNNAYVVSLDQAAEEHLSTLMAPAGPIQWIGTYDPYYKMDPRLTGAPSAIEVQIGILNGPETESTLAAIRGYALEQTVRPHPVSNQVVVRMKVDPAALPSIAQISNVLWIELSAPIEKRDEVQDLIMAERISGAGNGPVPGFDDYLDFLTNVVGFSTNPSDYPVLDVADTLAESTAFFNDFFEFGNPANPTRLVGFASLCTPGDTLCDDFHGPFVMSVVGAYNDTRDTVNLDANGFRKGLGVSPFGQLSNLIIFHLETPLCVGCLPNSDHGFSDVALNEYLIFGARISNNSWGDSPLTVNTGGNAGSYNDECQIFDGTVRDAVPTGTAIATNTVISGSGTNTVTNTVVGVVSTPTPFRLNHEMITAFAGGNFQGLGNDNGGFGSIIMTPPATAKNVITVGASENVRTALDAANQCGLSPSDASNSFELAFFTSFGPTLDGRIKPEIVAPGSGIFGVDGLATNFFTLVGTNEVEGTGNAYTCGSGTSFATPAISGAIQLLWWYFEHRLLNEQGQNYLQPSPAMAKAYLCNSARYLPITDPQTGAPDNLPSIGQGMGIVDLKQMFDGVPRVVRDESTPRAIDTPLITTNPVPQQTYFSSSGQSYEVSGQVADPTNPFRVTVAWTDVPGTPGAFKQLVNDLDLQVTIGGQTYFGNRFSGPTSVPVTVAGSPDNINNMESVFLPPGQTGTWSVVVRASDIAGNGVPNVPNSTVGQDFALVVYNAANAGRSDVPNLATNDSCQTAIEISTFPFSFTNVLSKAVYHNTFPSPTAGTGGANEFFKISRPTPGTAFTIDTFGSLFDTVLSVWQVSVFPEAVFVSGECGALQELVSDNDANGGLQSSVSFTADGSNDYYVVAEPHNDGPGGMLVLDVNTSASCITLTPNSLAFGSQIQGTTSAVQTVTYQNSCVVNARVSDVTITGDNASDFEITSQTCAGNIINSGTNCFASIAFLPQGVGSRQANLVFIDDQTGGQRIVPLSGTGLPPAPLVCLSATNGLAFTNTAVGATSAPQSLVINNCGSDLLNISGVTLSGVGSNDFTAVPSCGSTASISPGGTCTISVTFHPLVSGTRSATLTIASDASSSPNTVVLTGLGFTTAPSICFSSGTVNLGAVGVNGTGAVQSVTVTNCGSAPLVISSVTVTGVNASDFILISNSCSTVPTGATCAVSLVFAPSGPGNRSASLSFVDNSSGSPHLLPLVGSGALSQPDASIGKTPNQKKMVGAGVINTTGIGQEVVQTVRRGAKVPVRFYVSVENIGSGTDQFLVQGDGSSGGFTVSYFLGANPNPADSVNVSSAVTAGSFATSTMAPEAVTGDTTMIRVEVLADKNIVAKGTTKTFTITFTSASDPTKQDAVRATVTAK